MRNPESFNAISIDTVIGLNSKGELRVDTTITFKIRFNNYYGYNAYGFSNGFRVYSPDGATWDTTVISDINPSFNSLYDLGGVLVNEQNVDGMDSDTIGAGGGSWSFSGMDPDYDTVVFSIQIGPIASSMAGKTIIFDSCPGAPTAS